MEDSILLEAAFKIAGHNLISCCHDLGIIAGLHQFSDLWARDSFFATFGANIIDQKKATEKTIETFLSFQRSDGLIPYRIQRSPTTVEKYFGKPKYYNKPRPNFRSHQSGGLVLDGGLMLIIAFTQYIKVTKNINFLKKYYHQLDKCINWYSNKYNKSLLNEWFLCEWQDSVLKVGKTLYSNILYWKAITDFVYVSNLIGSAKSIFYNKLASEIKAKINSSFWNGQYFADWIDYKRHDILNTYGNLLSVWWGMADRKQSKLIMNFAQKQCLQSFTLEENYPSYSFWRIPIWNHLLGLSDYHNRGCLWLQPGIIYALCLDKLGEKQRAQSMLASISKKIVEHNGVYEIYEKDGNPVKRFFYRSEFPFAWSSGLYLYASDIILK